MDIESTIQFILESQARAEVRMEKADQRMEKAGDRMDKFDQRMEKFEARMERNERRVDAMEKRLDKRMDAIAKLLQHGMRRLAETQDSIKELAQAQRETDKTLRAFINSLRQRRNGN